MSRQIKQATILCLSFSVLALMAGCSQPNKQKTQPQTPSAEPIKESVQTDPKPSEPAPEPQAPASDEAEAVKRMEFAVRYMDSAEKGILSYSQPVVMCRDIIKDYPGTPYETQARQLLRQVPEDQRPRYHITDEELGL